MPSIEYVVCTVLGMYICYKDKATGTFVYMYVAYTKLKVDAPQPQYCHHTVTFVYVQAQYVQSTQPCSFANVEPVLSSMIASLQFQTIDDGDITGLLNTIDALYEL